MRFVTIASSPHPGLDRLLRSAEHYHVPLEVLGIGRPYHGHGTKIQHISEFADRLNPDEVVVFTDAYDSVFLAPPQAFEQAFEEFGGALVFSAEQNFHLKGHPIFYVWQNWLVHRRYPKGFGRYRFLNSGSYLGKAGHLATIARELSIRPDTPSCQSVFSLDYCRHPERYILDHEHRLMTCNGGRIGLEDRDYSWIDGRLRNNLTGSFPALLHVPGNNEESLGRILEGAPFERRVHSSAEESRLYRQRARLHRVVDATVGDNFLFKFLGWNALILITLVLLCWYLATLCPW
jgi:hypothetical protein